MKKKKSKKIKKSNSNLKYIIWLWLSAIFLLLLIAAIFVLVKFSKLPDISDLENPKYDFATVIYDCNNRELGQFGTNTRVWTSYDELNPYLVKALVATEDIRFFSHSGIDARGTIRAFAYLGKKGGASTITQQLAKLFFTVKRGNTITRIWQKLQEWLIAIEMEKRYTKEEILAMYLNEFDFLYFSHGIESASRTYFGKSQKDLTADEAAVLIAMLKWPNKYNPKDNPDMSLKRRNVVLNQMKKYGYLSQKEYEKLRKRKLDNSHFKTNTHYKGNAPYFRAVVKDWVKNLLDKEEYRKPDGTKYNHLKDGLRIYTTIDLDYQKLAEKVVQRHMSSLQKDYDRVWEGKDPWFYGVPKDKIASRKRVLNRFIKESVRFKELRKRILNPTINEIKEEYPDARLWDTDIQRMLNQEKNKNYFNKLLKTNYVSKKQVNTYKKILSSPLWGKLKAKQKELNNAVRVSFNKKTKMKVFAYNGVGEKMVVMTPIDSIKYHSSILQTGVLAMDPHTGYIKSWVGGVNFKYFQLDHINTRRQVGSTFKPFIYATAVFNGISPCMKVPDVQYTISPGDGGFGLSRTWKPSNANGKFTGTPLTLYDGLLKSKNSVSVFLMKELGNVGVVKNIVNEFGIDKKYIPNQPSICLGAADLSVMQMTGAYSVFANNGVYNKPLFVTRIEDKNGKIIYNAIPEQKKAFPDDYNYAMVRMLQYAGKFIQPKIKTPVGGKTGTTNDYRDGWFMGISPNLVVGTWVGGSEQFIKFNSLKYGQGGYMARPIFQNFMIELEKNKDAGYNSDVEFFEPEENVRLILDCDVYDKMSPISEPDQILEDEME